MPEKQRTRKEKIYGIQRSFTLFIFTALAFPLYSIRASEDYNDNTTCKYFSIAKKLVGVDNDRSMEYLNEILRINPNSRNAYYVRGIAAWSKKDWQLVQSDFLHLAQLSPNSPDTFFCLGNMYLLMPIPDYNEAIRQYDKVIALNPKYEAAYVNKAVALYLLSETKMDIQTAVTVALESKVSSERSIYLEEASKLIGKVTRMNPNLFSAHFNKGVVLNSIFREKEAVVAFSKATEVGLKYCSLDNISLCPEFEKENQYIVGNYPVCLISSLYAYLLEEHTSWLLKDGRKIQSIGHMLTYVGGE